MDIKRIFYKVMSKFNVTVVAALGLTLTAPAFASNPTISQANNEAGFDANYSYYTSQNPATGMTYQRLNNHLLGLELDFTKTFRDHIYMQLNYFTTSGNLSYQSNINLSPATLFLEEMSARLGYAFFPSNNTALTPYFTAGYQYWQFDTGGTPAGANFINGYTLFYQNAFYGLGLLAQWAANARVVLSADIQVGNTAFSWMNYNAPNTAVDSAGNKAIVYQQSDLPQQPFVKLGVSGDYQFNHKLHGRAGVQYATEKFGSNITHPSNLYQPAVLMQTWTYHAGVAYELDDISQQQALESNITADAILKADNQASLLFGLINQNYGEQSADTTHYLDRQNGIIPYTNFLITKTFEQIYTQLSMSFAGGDTQYLGELIGSGAPFVASTRNDMLDLQAKLGYLFFPTDYAGITPYFVGGYHRWLRDINGASFKGLIVSGYPETYQHAFYGVGILTQLVATPAWVLNVDGNYGVTHHPQNRAWCSFTSPNTTEVVSSLGVRNLYSIGVSSDYLFLHTWHFLAGVDYLRFKYGASPPDNLGIYEPNSRTMEVFYNVGIGYEIDR